MTLPIAYQEYVKTLPRNGRGIKWDIDSFSIAVPLRYPGFTLKPGQEWKGSEEKMIFICSKHGEFDTQPRTFLLDSDNLGPCCVKCSAQKAKDSWGKKRQPRATEAEKAKARKLRAEGKSYYEISDELNRSRSAIQCWCDPKHLEKHRAKNAAYDIANRESNRDYSRRYYHETEHGKAIMDQHAALRIRDQEGEWIGLSPAEKEQILDLYKQRDRLNKEAGHTAYEIDHIYPVSKGGSHSLYNLRILSKEENRSKSAKVSADDWALYQQRVAELFQTY